MPNALKALLPILALAVLGQGHAMSRHHDGEARVWVNDGVLCLGAAETYEVSSFLSSSARLDQNQVDLYALQVNQPSTQAWELSAAQGKKPSAVRLEPGGCIEYGQPLAGLETQVPPRPLAPGVYEVFLQASDQKNRRVWFYKRFCLAGEAGAWMVTQARREDGTQSWHCDE